MKTHEWEIGSEAEPLVRAYEAPGKVFLLGEYAVLAGLPGWLVGTGPRFRLERHLGTSGDAVALPFAEESPAGRLLHKAIAEAPSCAKYAWRWEDPHQGAGGFGASSAQFILLYRALAEELRWPIGQEHALAAYRTLHEDNLVPPSGADIAAQWVGGVVRFDAAHGAQRACIALDNDRMLLFSATGIAGRKIRTHEHLEKLGRSFFTSHRESLAEAGALLTKFDAVVQDTTTHDDIDKGTEALAEFLDAYAAALFRAGLEDPGATEDRLALRSLPGVAAVKGTGAGLSDALWVILKAGVTDEQRQAIGACAKARGLQRLSLSFLKMGISEETN